MLLIVGLGNPGEKYEKTRHNMGFVVLDNLKEHLTGSDVSDWSLSKKFNAQICGGQIKGLKVILAKPMTYMNRSGETVGLIANYYKLNKRNIIVIHDEKDFELGVNKIQEDKNSAGHLGVESIINHIGSKNFRRLRMGIGTKKLNNRKDASKFVLGKFGIIEKLKVKQSINEAVNMLLDIISKEEK